MSLSSTGMGRRNRRVRRALLLGLVGGSVGVLVVLAVKHSPPDLVPSPAASGPFAEKVRFERRSESGGALVLRAARLWSAHPRLLGPFRIGFLREIRAEDVHLEVDLPGESPAATGGSDLQVDEMLQQMMGPQHRRISAVTLVDLELEIRQVGRSAIALRAKRGEWRAGEASITLRGARTEIGGSGVMIPRMAWNWKSRQLMVAKPIFVRRERRWARLDAAEAPALFEEWKPIVEVRMREVGT